MQLFILILGAMIFVFYQFTPPPVFFNQTAWHSAVRADSSGHLNALAGEFAAIHTEKEQLIQRWLEARRSGDATAAAAAENAAATSNVKSEAVRDEAKSALVAINPHAQKNDADYIFITFILDHLPHGLIGLLVAAFFAAALSSKAAELNALGSTSVVDVYRHIVVRDATDAHYVVASKLFTVFWGLMALSFALLAHMAENLIQATNIVSSVFYGVPLAIFLAGFFIRRIGGSAIFFAALLTQAIEIITYALGTKYPVLDFSYLWYNLIGCVLCLAMALLIQVALIGEEKHPVP
jgi:Na+(H+)/acetate symporter ActP